MSRLTNTLAQAVNQPIDPGPVYNTIEKYRQRMEWSHNNNIVGFVHIKLLVREFCQRATRCIVCRRHSAFDGILPISNDRHNDCTCCRNSHEHVFRTVCQMEG